MPGIANRSGIVRPPVKAAVSVALSVNEEPLGTILLEALNDTILEAGSVTTWKEVLLLDPPDVAEAV